MKTNTIPADKSLAPLLQYLDESPTPFHAVANLAARLDSAGYVRADLGAAKAPSIPGKYYFTQNDSSLIALRLAAPPGEDGFRLVGAHTDSPCLKVKPNAIDCNNQYAKLAVDVYGGALLAPWFDRDLGLAGKVCVDDARGLRNVLLNIRRPIAVIPSLAIHLARNVNDKRKINRQREMPAVLCRVGDGDDKNKSNRNSTSKKKNKNKNKSNSDVDGHDNVDNTNIDSFDTRVFERFLLDELAQQHGETFADDARVLAHELSLYDCQRAALVGVRGEFIASARLDNLLSCYAGGAALLGIDAHGAHDERAAHNAVLVLNDHEEVGSESAGGAGGAFLSAVLRRVCGGDDEFLRAMHRSMLLSADNAHGVHPNYPHKHEPNHTPLLNGGVTLKINHNQRYATSAETAALFRRLCAQRGLAVQTIVTRSDMACGSTIGPITAAKLGVRTADIGAPQLAMHSVRELAGANDQADLCAALLAFFTAELS